MSTYGKKSVGGGTKGVRNNKPELTEEQKQ